MKKVVSSLFACTIAIMMSFSSVLAYNTSKIDASYEKILKFYESKEELRSFDEIIAVESLGLEAENYQLPDISSVDFENETLGNITKGIISLILIGENPNDYNENNLIELLESCIQEDGSIEKDGYVATSNIQVWVLYALECYDSDKVDLVANNLLQTMNENGSFGYGYGTSSADVTGWCLEALTNAGLSDKLGDTKEYLNNNDRFDENGTWGYSYPDTKYDENGNPIYKYDDEGNPIMINFPNSTSQAAVLIGLIVNDKEGLLNGNYDFNNVNPLDVLADYQNKDGTYWDDENISYETFDTVRALGTYKNGSFVYRAQSVYKDLTVETEEVENTEEQPEVEEQEQKETLDEKQIEQNDDKKENEEVNKETNSVKTGDNSQIVLFISVSVISSGLYLILRKEYEKIH